MLYFYKNSIRSASRYNTDSIRAFYPLLGDPLSKFEVIHVAGTNGKGTFTHKTSLALQAAGYRTGQFLTPHVCTLRERVQVDQ